MVEQSNNNDMSINADAVYRRYRQARTAAAHRQVQPETIAVSSASSSNDETLAEDIFARYRATRATAKDATVDSIMQRIEQAQIQDVLPQAQQAIATTAPQIKSIDALTEVPAANGPSLFKRFLLPAVAATLLSVLIIPKILQHGSDSSDLQASMPAVLPAALSVQAEQAVTFISTDAVTSFGFSSSQDAAKTAFNNGVVATDLALLLAANEHASATRLLSQLAAQATLKASAEQLSAAISARADKETLQQGLVQINTALESQSQQAKQLDWFKAGQAVEATRLSAELAMNTSATEAVEQALAIMAKLKLPATQSSGSSLLKQLQQTQLDTPEPFVQISKVLDSTNDIKLLMQ